MAASFAQPTERSAEGQLRVTSSRRLGFDLTPLVQRGDAVLLAWAPNYSPVKPLNQFSPRRSRRNTLLRVAAAN